METVVTEHTVCGYWCSDCKRIVFAAVSDALPNAMIGLRVIVFTAWLHYLIGVSVNNIVKILQFTADFQITAGGLTQAWKNQAFRLALIYQNIGRSISDAAVLHADETGWRVNGITHWLWGFATKTLCYYVIDKSRGSPVIKRVIGSIFNGILISDFQGAYNKICALARQRCFYHLFTASDKTDKHNQSKDWKAFRKKFSRLLRDAIRLSERRDQINVDVYQRRQLRLYARLDLLIVTDSEDKDVKRIIKRIIKRL